MDFGGKHIDAGDDSIGVIGDGNTIEKHIHYAAFAAPVRRSYLYELCQVILDSDIEPSDEDSIESNAKWQEKLDFNRVSPQYAEIFDNDSYAYDDMVEIVTAFPNGVILLRKIHNIYLEKEREREVSGQDGDFVLREVFGELERMIDTHEDTLEARMADEERDRCLWLIMFYVFTQCQLLRKPQ
ncbi:MAG TPA: hypothetical protein VFM05_10010 [Candidatus Saccharimonadales bacterium]|nr:hypothetical protein [Candidatus Saccharimonadales bacterium]